MGAGGGGSGGSSTVMVSISTGRSSSHSRCETSEVASCGSSSTVMVPVTGHCVLGGGGAAGGSSTVMEVSGTQLRARQQRGRGWRLSALHCHSAKGTMQLSGLVLLGAAVLKRVLYASSCAVLLMSFCTCPPLFLLLLQFVTNYLKKWME